MHWHVEQTLLLSLFCFRVFTVLHYRSGLHEFDRMGSLEVSDFRAHMRQMVKETANERDRTVSSVLYYRPSHLSCVCGEGNGNTAAQQERRPRKGSAASLPTV